MREVKSPDGHVWRVERFHAPKESHRDGFFWPTLIATILLLGLLFFFIFVVHSKAVWIAFLVVFVIWVIERLSYFLRPSIRATTQGPPPQTYVWKTRHRSGYDRIETEIATEISRGDLGSEPEGATLVSSG